MDSICMEIVHIVIVVTQWICFQCIQHCDYDYFEIKMMIWFLQSITTEQSTERCSDLLGYWLMATSHNECIWSKSVLMCHGKIHGCCAGIVLWPWLHHDLTHALLEEYESQHHDTVSLAGQLVCNQSMIIGYRCMVCPLPDSHGTFGRTALHT